MSNHLTALIPHGDGRAGNRETFLVATAITGSPPSRLTKSMGAEDAIPESALITLCGIFWSADNLGGTPDGDALFPSWMQVKIGGDWYDLPFDKRLVSPNRSTDSGADVTASTNVRNVSDVSLPGTKTEEQVFSVASAFAAHDIRGQTLQEGSAKTRDLRIVVEGK